MNERDSLLDASVLVKKGSLLRSSALELAIKRMNPQLYDELPKMSIVGYVVAYACLVERLLFFGLLKNWKQGDFWNLVGPINETQKLEAILWYRLTPVTDDMREIVLSHDILGVAKDRVKISDSKK